MILWRTLRRISLYVGIGLVVAAVATELRKPAAQRTWQGRIAGVVPYSFRLPLPAPVPSDGWHGDIEAAGDQEKLLIPRSFGVGWSLNVPALMRRLRALRNSGRPTTSQ